VFAFLQALIYTESAMKRTLLVTCLVLVVALAPACAISAVPLDRVLAVVPRDLTEVMLLFTNWSQIKSNLGLTDLTSGSPIKLRLELVRRTSQDQAAASVYALAHIQSHSVTWGWDTADLVWEANVVSREWPQIHILQLRNDFDFSPVAAHFVERGFTQTESHGAVVYTHALDVRADWIRTTELSILNTAYIDEEKTMILSSSPRAVEMCLAASAGEVATLAEDPFTCAAVEHLNNLASAIVLRGLGECLRFTPNPILDLIGTIPSKERVAELKAMMEERELLVPYRALGVGYRQEESRPVGTIVFEYDTPELATMDLPTRLLLAQEGMSTHYNTPIAESYFTILDFDVQDSAVILTVAPINDQPNRLFRMIFYLDAAFAGCSS